MKIDHIGVGVKTIEKGVKQWTEAFGYSQMTEVVENTRQKVFVTFMEKENSTLIKLIAPTDETSPIAKFTAKGGGLHHICFKTDNMEEKIVDLKSNGLRMIAKPQPGEAFENEDIAFLLGRNGLNIELIETDKKAKQITK